REYLLGRKISFSEIEKVSNLVSEIESKITGRIAGDVDDYVLNYFLSEHVSQRFSEQTDLLGIEIGTLFGGSLIVSLSAKGRWLGNHKVLAIDPLNGYYKSQGGSELDIVLSIPIDRQTLDSNLQTFGFKDVEVLQS